MSGFHPKGLDMLYSAFHAQSQLLGSLRAWSQAVDAGLSFVDGDRVPAARSLAAHCAVLALSEITHARPPWRIDSALVGGVPTPVTESAASATPFATLRCFKVSSSTVRPRVLLVAPMSGHFATLLRDTVRTLLRDHDVYVTDWHNIRDIPLAEGRFGLDEYTHHLIDFLAAMGPDAHVVAVCQPTVSAFAAVALMAEDEHPCTPASLTLMAGPIDCRVAPTEVNRLATSKPIEWFRDHLISLVPWNLRGRGRRVYPGFLQLSAFMSMNPDRHAEAFKNYYCHLVAGRADDAELIRAFYTEYLAVSDLSADFYLETVDQVFQKYALARGELRVRGRRVDPTAIRRTALVTIEGERDDICAVGQTLAAQDLATRLRPYLRTHYVQPNVGHYGVFSGKRWQRHIYPLIRNVIHVSA